MRFLSLEYPFTSWQGPSHAESLAYDLASDAEQGCDLAHRDAIAVELVDSVVPFLDCPVLPQRFGEECRVDVGLDKHGCDVVHFPKGAGGLHQVVNRCATPVRYIVASTNATPEVCEYPDSGKAGVFSRESSTRGEMLATMHRFDDAVDYLEGERPRE